MAKKKPQITSKKSKKVEPVAVGQVEPVAVDQVEPVAVGLIPQADYGISTWIRERDERLRRVIEERLARRAKA